MLSAKLFFLPLCVFFVQGTLLNTNNERIFGGYPAEEGQLPHQVSIRTQGSAGGFRCSGSLISTRHVLTAAGCFRRQDSATVTMGSIDLTLGIAINSSKFTINPNYIQAAGFFDIAIVTLEREIEISPNVKPIRLPRQSEIDLSLEDQLAIVAGWGQIADSDYPETLHWLDQRVIAKQVCTDRHGPIGDLNSTICCQKYQSRNICGGDFGAPLIMKDSDGEFTLIGVSNSLYYDCSNDGISVYAYTGRFLDWISEVTEMPIRP